jgi:hypothetical protein
MWMVMSHIIRHYQPRLTNTTDIQQQRAKKYKNKVILKLFQIS